MIVPFKIKKHEMLSVQAIEQLAYSFNSTFFKLICLTAKSFHRMTMNIFLVGATELKKCTLKRVQLRILG